MKFNLKFISLILILFFISLSVVSAEDTTQIYSNVSEIETNFHEIEIDNQIVELKSFNELQQQIWRAIPGDTIKLENDYISDSVKDEIAIDKSIKLDGKGHTLNANNSAIFYIKKGITNVEIKNIKFINGQRSCGGAIFADNDSNNLTITNCTFKNNRATTSNVGGAVYIKANNCTITDNLFENNIARTSGGAIRIEGNSYIITNNRFNGNIATGILGGAICALGHKIKIINNTFTKNIAGRDGGAIDIEGTLVAQKGTENIISKNIFDSNKATGSKEGSYGGAISINGQNCTIANNKFTNNHADTLGGAIRWNGANSNTGIIIENKFEGNDARSGGAIYVSGSELTISKNTFNNNKATGGAGGTLNINGDSAIILNNKITKSSTKSSGGAIYLDGKFAKLINNHIKLCRAGDDGGAAYIKGASTTIKNNKFISNNAGKLAGAAIIKTSNAHIKNNEFSRNVAKSSGGAAYIEGRNIIVHNNTFSKNKAGSANVGGAIRFYGNDAKITKNKFISNTAGVGFAYYGNGENPTITSNTFTTKKINTERWEKTNVKLTTPTKTFKKSLKTKKVVITLKSASNKALSKKKITLTVNKKTYKATTNSKGQATITIKLTKKGTYKYTAKFAGNKYYNPLSKKGTIKIK